MLALATDEDRSPLPAGRDVRLCLALKPLGEVFEVLDDASLLDVEAPRISAPARFHIERPTETGKPPKRTGGETGGGKIGVLSVTSQRALRPRAVRLSAVFDAKRPVAKTAQAEHLTETVFDPPSP
jgi:hypothetical protein